MKLVKMKRILVFFICIFVFRTAWSFDGWEDNDDSYWEIELPEVSVSADRDDKDDDWIWQFDDDEKIDDDVHIDDMIPGGELDEVGVTAPKPGNNNEKPNIQVVAPYAKEIFKNDKMSDNSWNILERMIEKIIKDCIGEALYEGLKIKLKGKVFTIVFDINPPGGGETVLNNSSIILRDLESNTLFHEMMHAYQAYGETMETFEKAQLNLEIEAWYAQYLYLSKLPEFKPGSKWDDRYAYTDIGDAILRLKNYISPNGTLLQSSSALDIHVENTANIFQTGADYDGNSPYKYAKFDKSRKGMENFKSLKQLSKNCN